MVELPADVPQSQTTPSRPTPAVQQRMRRQVLAGFAAFGMWWGGWGTVVPAVQTSAGVNHGELGTALLFVAVGALILMRWTGALIDRFGAPVLPLSVLIFGVAGMAPAWASGTLQLAGALLVVGAGSGAMDVAINTASATYENTVRQPLMNLAHAFFSIGVIVGAVAGGVLRSLGAGPLGVLGALAVLLLAISAWLARGTGSLTTAQERSRPSWSWWSPPRRVLVLGSLVALSFLVENAWQSWSAVHLERTLGAVPATGALGPVLFGASAAVGRLSGQRLTRSFAEHALVRAGALLAAVGTVVAAAAPTIPVALVGIVAAGLGTAVCAPMLLSLAGRGVPEGQRGAVIGTVTTLAYLGFVLSPALVGLTARLTSLPVALGSIAAAAVALTLLAGKARP